MSYICHLEKNVTWVTRLSGMAKRKAGASPPAIEGADKKGKQSDAGLRGDDAVVQQRRP